MINNHNNELKNKITFYGNDLLINDYKNLEKKYRPNTDNLPTK